MRILHIDTGREMRGGQWQAWFLIEELAARGHDCTLLAPAASPLARRGSKAGFSVRPPGLAAVWREARHADLVHAHTGRGHTLAAAAGVRKLVVSRRVAFPVRRNVASRWKYSRADRYIAVSRTVKQTLLDADVDEGMIAVVYDGVPDMEPVMNGEKIVAPASEDPRKGAALTLEAARIAGVSVHPVSDLRSGLSEAALFVYLTDLEGLGSGALLAMAAQVPVIASRVGGLTEVVEDGVTGLLVDNSAAAVAAAIRELMADPERRWRMGVRGRERVEQNFTIKQLTDGTIAAYEKALS